MIFASLHFQWFATIENGGTSVCRKKLCLLQSFLEVLSASRENKCIRINRFRRVFDGPWARHSFTVPS